MRKEIEEFITIKNTLTFKLEQYVKDKSVPLEERWNLFIKSEFGKHSNYYKNFNCKIDNDFIDTLEDKYKTHNVEDIVDFAIEKEYSIEDIIEFKENVLDGFIYSFEYYW